MTPVELNVKSVIFDMDGVITNTMPDHCSSWKSVLRDEGLNVSSQDIYKREGQPGLLAMRDIFKEHQKPFDKEFGMSVLKKKEDLFRKIVKIRFICGARSFLKYLHRNNIRLALVTGTSKYELNQILPEGLRKLFSVVITGDGLKYGKPHPEPYLKSLKGLAIDSSQAVVIENAPFGIQSAKEAGIKCFALETSLSREYLSKADSVFVSIKELRQKVNFYPWNAHE